MCFVCFYFFVCVFVLFIVLYFYVFINTSSFATKQYKQHNKRHKQTLQYFFLKIKKTLIIKIKQFTETDLHHVILETVSSQGCLLTNSFFDKNLQYDTNHWQDLINAQLSDYDTLKIFLTVTSTHLSDIPITFLKKHSTLKDDCLWLPTEAI